MPVLIGLGSQFVVSKHYFKLFDRLGLGLGTIYMFTTEV